VSNRPSPDVLKSAKEAFKRVQQLDWDMSEDFLISKQEQLWFVAGEERDEGMKQFLDDKTFKPSLGMYKRPHKE
jgi:trans-feruloyl-CoA hydratase/vanillin synthase